MTRLGWCLAVLAALPLCAVAADDEIRANYLFACRGCHLADGKGVPPEIPSLRNVLGQLVATPEGRNYVMRVPGVLQSRLNNEQLADVLNWILTEFNADTRPGDFQPFSEREVAEARKHILTDPSRMRASLKMDSTIE
ncbi:MAG: cytochrome c [Woeseiaceae bacterium]